MILRDYQLRAVDAVRDAFGRVRRVLLVLPTGAGKTAVASVLITRAHWKGRRCVFLVHRREIVRDTARRLRAAGVPCGVVMAGEPASDDPVQVASVQTIAARDLAIPADFLVWDECHHVAAASYRTIAAKYPAAHHLGLTATPQRSDRAGLRDAFDELVTGATIAELTAAGVLAPCDVVGPAKRRGALAMTALEAYQRHAGKRPTVVFCDSVASSVALVAALTASGVAAAHVDGNTPARTRDRILEEFADGRLDVVSNVGVLTEGWDCPAAEVVILARGCDSAGTFLQIIGRALRRGRPGKRALLVDLCGAVHQHGMPEARRDWTLDGLKVAKPAPDAIRQCATCGAVYLAAKHPRSCPNGHRPPPREAREVKPAKVARITSTVDRAEQQAEFDRLSALARDRQWKPKAVGVMFKERFGFWPAGMRETRRAA